jgi:hypothetical protein
MKNVHGWYFNQLRPPGASDAMKLESFFIPYLHATEHDTAAVGAIQQAWTSIYRAHGQLDLCRDAWRLAGDPGYFSPGYYNPKKMRNRNFNPRDFRDAHLFGLPNCFCLTDLDKFHAVARNYGEQGRSMQIIAIVDQKSSGYQNTEEFSEGAQRSLGRALQQFDPPDVQVKVMRQFYDERPPVEMVEYHTAYTSWANWAAPPKKSQGAERAYVLYNIMLHLPWYDDVPSMRVHDLFLGTQAFWSAANADIQRRANGSNVLQPRMFCVRTVEDAEHRQMVAEPHDTSWEPVGPAVQDSWCLICAKPFGRCWCEHPLWGAPRLSSVF